VVREQPIAGSEARLCSVCGRARCGNVDSEQFELCKQKPVHSYMGVAEAFYPRVKGVSALVACKGIDRLSSVLIKGDHDLFIVVRVVI
jgi:hypothetical protein